MHRQRGDPPVAVPSAHHPALGFWPDHPVPDHPVPGRPQQDAADPQAAYPQQELPVDLQEHQRRPGA
ncbi:hypothetical protein N601_10200 [Rhodococcus erythropolis DN1]|nr:hypothetical protein N601_10200 [Rhodococcus erythropolis DN1]